MNNYKRHYNSRSYSRHRNRKTTNIDINRLIKKVDFEVKETPYEASYKFDDLNISSELKQNIKRKGFISPTPIQDQSIPHIIEGKDIVGIANTGTGKTGAFLIPLIDEIFRNRRQKALIIAPTRELAKQIDDELYSLTKSMNIFSVLCVGGSSIGNQINNLRRNYNFVVGTPGRILDLTNRKVLNLNSFKTIVLDEVDRMLDMGFIQDVKLIISGLPEERHSMFFSATITPEIEKIMNSFVRDYVKVSVKTGDTAQNINQDIIRVKDKSEKVLKLEELLISSELKKVLIFVKTKYNVDKLDKHLYGKGFKVNCLHGNKSQYQRARALESFKKGEVNILVATDVAARGLDVPNVTHVINFDMPDTYEDYVHRIGRTGRASQIGNALTFVEMNPFMR